MDAARQERLPQLDIYRALAITGVLHVHASSFAAGEQALNSPIITGLTGSISFLNSEPRHLFFSAALCCSIIITGVQLQGV